MQGNAWALKGALWGEAPLCSNVVMGGVEAYVGSLMEGCTLEFGILVVSCMRRFYVWGLLWGG